MKHLYNDLRHYGKIIADKEHETTEGMFIRFTTYLYNDTYYVVTMVDGNVFMIAEKEDVRELISNDWTRKKILWIQKNKIWKYFKRIEKKYWQIKPSMI